MEKNFNGFEKHTQTPQPAPEQKKPFEVIVDESPDMIINEIKNKKLTAEEQEAQNNNLKAENASKWNGFGSNSENTEAEESAE